LHAVPQFYPKTTRLLIWQDLRPAQTNRKFVLFFVELFLHGCCHRQLEAIFDLVIVNDIIFKSLHLILNEPKLVVPEFPRQPKTLLLPVDIFTVVFGGKVGYTAGMAGI